MTDIYNKINLTQKIIYMKYLLLIFHLSYYLRNIYHLKINKLYILIEVLIESNKHVRDLEKKYFIFEKSESLKKIYDTNEYIFISKSIFMFNRSSLY